jgi:wyosine [tRNA(Phe)-imidazoG37] synthetase (radical SAM superfamily)
VSTFLFDKIVFGPVKSRRLGISLGINLLPTNRKLCNFDCVYCECGLNITNDIKSKLPAREEVSDALKKKLQEMQAGNQLPDVITYAGNGEPTIHPQFDLIIEDTIQIRNQFCPNAKISVLSNATMLHSSKVVNALKKVDQNILKLDSGLNSSIVQINRPSKFVGTQNLIDQLKQFEGNLIIQTLFTRGTINNTYIDNTTPENIDLWCKAIISIRPQKVMIYTIDRDTPFEGLKKVSLQELQTIAKKINELGIDTQVSG